jgi:hypothetical protein
MTQSLTRSLAGLCFPRTKTPLTRAVQAQAQTHRIRWFLPPSKTVIPENRPQFDTVVRQRLPHESPQIFVRFDSGNRF